MSNMKRFFMDSVIYTASYNALMRVELEQIVNGLKTDHYFQSFFNDFENLYDETYNVENSLGANNVSSKEKYYRFSNDESDEKLKLDIKLNELVLNIEVNKKEKESEKAIEKSKIFLYALNKLMENKFNKVGSIEITKTNKLYVPFEKKEILKDIFKSPFFQIENDIFSKQMTEKNIKNVIVNNNDVKVILQKLFSIELGELKATAGDITINKDVFVVKFNFATFLNDIVNDTKLITDFKQTESIFSSLNNIVNKGFNECLNDEFKNIIEKHANKNVYNNLNKLLGGEYNV